MLNFSKATLPNGVRIVTEEMPYVRSVSIGIWVGAGSRDEDEDNNGVTHFLEHLLFKGTQKRSAKDIAESLEAVGGQLNAFTTKEYTCYYAKVLDEHLDLAVDVLTDMFFNSVLDPKEIQKERNVVLEEIKMYEDSPDELIHDLFVHALWQGHPLGRPILGSAASILNMSREKIVSYFQKNYTPDQIVVAVAGKVKHEEIVRTLTPIFQGLQGSKPKRNDSSPIAKPSVIMNKKETEQVQICLGTPGLALEDEAIYSMHILNNVLGGGLSSRLFQEIREERGLAYSVYSYHSAYRDGGHFTVYAGTSPNNVNQVMELILKEISRVKQEGITCEELERTKEQIKGSMYLGLESVTSRMTRIGKSEISYGRLIPLEEIINNITKVTLDQVKALAGQLFRPESFTLATIGPVYSEVNYRQLLDAANI